METLHAFWPGLAPRICRGASVAALMLAFASTALHAQMLQNGSFEDFDGQVPARWAPANQDAAPALDTREAQQGAACLRFDGDGVARSLRQSVGDMPTKPFTVTGWVRGDGAMSDGATYAYLYVHVIYRDQPYGAATHAYHRVEPGTYEWRRVEVRVDPVPAYQIKEVLVTCTARFKGGSIWFDNLGLTWSTLGFDLRRAKEEVDWLLEGLPKASDAGADVADALAQARKASGQIGALQAELDTVEPEAGATVLAQAQSSARAALDSLSPEAAGAFWAAVSDSPGEEIRAVYHGSGRTPDEVRANLDRLQRMGGNALYPSLGGWNGVSYESDLAPTIESWQGSDGLDELIRQGRERGVKVVPYLAVFHTMAAEDGVRDDLPPTFFAHRHPADPQRARIFPAPSHPEVREYMVRMYAELVARHAPDGIGLDYIRYPHPKAICVCERCRAQVRERYGFDPLDGDPWEDETKRLELQQWRAEHITATVRAIAAEVRRIKPDILIMAHCISDPEGAAKNYAQDWAGFADALDWATPMNYGKPGDDAGLLGKQAAAVRGKCLLVPAIGGMPTQHAQASPRDWLDRIALARTYGQGVAIYAFGYIHPDTQLLLHNGPFRTPATWPVMMGDENRGR